MSESNCDLSSDELNEHIQKIYICFCQKRFTTYPGIYLHLKSKHVHLFAKYKKLKITKLFKKIHDSNGTEIYKLDKLSDIEKSTNNGSQKKVNQEKKPIPSTQQKQETPKPAHPEEPRNWPYPDRPFPEHMRQDEKYFLKFHQSMPQPMPNQRVPFPMGIPPYFHYPPMLPYPRPQIKRMLQRFLFQFNSEKTLLQKTMYNLMTYIDQNHSSIKDPRTKERVFLSYCDQFEPTFCNPLICQHIENLKKELWRTPEEENKKEIEKEIFNVQKFQEWLIEIGLIDPEFKIPQRQVERNSESKLNEINLVDRQESSRKSSPLQNGLSAEQPNSQK